MRFSAMRTLIIILMAITSHVAKGYCSGINEEHLAISNVPNKDMYVIHAMVYQAGILTNKTGNESSNSKLDYNTLVEASVVISNEQLFTKCIRNGQQEVLTIYGNKGTKVDLSGIPEPFLTNVSAQSLVGMAPRNSFNRSALLSWDSLNQIASSQQQANAVDASSKLNKRSLNNALVTVKVENGTASIPKEIGVNSIVFPALFALKNNFSEIPVPVPNNSVVHYARVNAVVKQP